MHVDGLGMTLVCYIRLFMISPNMFPRYSCHYVVHEGDGGSASARYNDLQVHSTGNMLMFTGLEQFSGTHLPEPPS